MEAKHTVYVLSSSERPNLFRYVGCTTEPTTRLANHANQTTLVGIWIYWERLAGHQVIMRQVAQFDTKLDGRDAEMLWIRSLTGQHLFNRESWPVAQHNAGVPSTIQYLYHQLLRLGTLKAMRGEQHDASEFIYLSKTLASQCSGLTINRVGRMLHADLAICNRLGVAECLPVVTQIEAMQVNYQGHTPECLRMKL